MKVVVLGTGGTIAGLADEAAHRGYRAAAVAVDDLAAGLDLPDGWSLHVEQVAQIDSKDMDDSVWLALAGRCEHWLAQADVGGIVVTHGTDTLEETAYFLHRVLDARKPVVLTGSMRPSDAAAPDGPGNLRDAFTLATHTSVAGVLVVFAGSVHGAREVRKAHATRLGAFESDGAGAVASVVSDKVVQHRAWPDGRADLVPQALPKLRARQAAGQGLPWVAWLTSHACARGDEVRVLVGAGVDGIVVAGTGSATLHHRLQAALDEARAAGVAVDVVSRCAWDGDGTGGNRSSDARAWPLQPAKARIALQLHLLQAAAP